MTTLWIVPQSAFCKFQVLDGRPIPHDLTCTTFCSCTGMIENTTFAQLQSCNANYASVFGNKYGFVPIPTFDQVSGATKIRVRHGAST